MGGVRLAGHDVLHLLDVAVIGGDQRFASDLFQRFNDPSDTLVQAFHRLDRGLEHAGVANHVAVGVVDDDHVVTLVLDGLDDAISHFGRAHFRLHVVSGDLRRRNQDALFARKGFLAAAGEEEGDVGVFLGLSNAQLGLAVVGEIFAEHVGQAFRGKRAGRRYTRGILRQHDEASQLRYPGALEFAEARLDEAARKFTCTVGAEVHEHHGIAVLDTDRLANSGGLDELVALATLVGGDQPVDCIVRVVLSFSVNNQAVRLLDPVPAVVTIHGEVAANQTCNAPFAQTGEGRLHQFDGVLCALRWRVAAIKKGVQVDFFGAALGSQFSHGNQMILVAVNASVGKQAEDMHGLACTRCLIDGGANGGVLEELAVADGFGDLREVLVHNAARAQVHVAHFGIAHLPVRQTHIHAAARDESVRLAGEQAVIDWLVGGVDGIELRIVAVSEAVENDQYQGFGRGGHVSGSLHEVAKKGGQSNSWPVGRHDSQGSAWWGACVYWPAFYPPGTL